MLRYRAADGTRSVLEPAIDTGGRGNAERAAGHSASDAVGSLKLALDRAAGCDEQLLSLMAERGMDVRSGCWGAGE
eukprot:2077521-Prymnesium_polylepis.1